MPGPASPPPARPPAGISIDTETLDVESLENARWDTDRMAQRLRSITVEPVVTQHWSDLAALFATSEVMRGCWCMWPRVPRGQHEVGDANEARLKTLVDGGTVIGLIAYVDGQPAGWCSIGPRAHYGRFFNEDADPDAWLIACLFIAPRQRSRGVASALLSAAAGYAADRGARRLEALPRGWRPDDDPSTIGAVMRLFRRAGFLDEDDSNAMARMFKNLV